MLYRLHQPLRCFLLAAAVLSLALPAARAQENERTEPEAAEEEEAPAPRRGGGKIMLPGSGAYGSKPSPESAPAPSQKPAESRAVAPARDAHPAAPDKTTGNLFWNGKIYKNGRIRISVDNQTTAGYVEGDPLPCVAVVVDARSPIVEIIEQPSARNGYKSFEFRVKKSSKDKISLNFHWMLASQ